MSLESKIHYCEHMDYIPPCGTQGRKTMVVSIITCESCQRKLLEGYAPWARAYLDKLRDRRGPVAKADDRLRQLRELAGSSQLDPISVPRALAKPVDTKVKGLGNGFARAFNQYRGSEKAVRELLPVFPASLGTIQPIMDDGGPPTDPVGVQEGQVADQPGDAGQVSDEAYWNY